MTTGNSSMAYQKGDVILAQITSQAVRFPSDYALTARLRTGHHKSRLLLDIEDITQGIS